MKLPKMIGTHVPKKPARRRPARCPLAETAEMINRSFDELTRREGRTHLVRCCTPMGSRR